MSGSFSPFSATSPKVLTNSSITGVLSASVINSFSSLVLLFHAIERLLLNSSLAGSVGSVASVYFFAFL